MATTRTISGYFGETNGRSVQGPVMVTFTGGAGSETLSLAFEGRYQVTVAFRAVERLANEARLEIRKAAQRQEAQGHSTYEFHSGVEGYCTDGRARLQKGTAVIWFRSNGSFEMLTLAYGDRGQISVPYAQVMALARTERSSFA